MLQGAGLKKASPKKDLQETIRELTHRKTPPSSVLIYGKERTRVERVLASLLQGISGDVLYFDGRSADAQMVRAIEAHTSAPTLFSPRSIAVIRFFNEVKAAEQKGILTLVGRAVSETPIIALIFAAEVSQKVRKEFGDVVEVSALKGFDVKRWVQREATVQGLAGIADDAMQMLIERNEGDLDRIYSDVTLLSLYCGAVKATGAEVRALFGAHAVDDEFRFIDELLMGRRERAAVMFEQLVHHGKSPHALLPFITRTIHNLAVLTKLLAQGYGEGALRERVQISPWYFNKLLPRARQTKLSDIERALSLLLVMDVRLKSKSVHPHDVISPLVQLL